MSAFDFDLTEVEDIADVALADASDYQDQTGASPLQPGNFRLRVLEATRAKTQDGENLDDNGYPQFQLTKLEVTEPEEFKGRVIYPFQKYSLRPVQGGVRKGTVPAVDLLRAFDDTLTFANGKEVIALIAQQVNAGKTFVAGTNWTAKDSDYIKEAIEENGGSLDEMSDDARKELFNKAIFRGQKKFPKVNGFYVPEVEGPSGATLEARVAITRLYPSSKVVKKMGPFKK
jgi:hypothetical protein